MEPTFLREALVSEQVQLLQDDIPPDAYCTKNI